MYAKADKSLRAYYNEIDPFAAEWLRKLIKHGHIAPGEVDERDIQDVLPSDLHGFRQCHFFAGIGGWSRALRLAGWPDDRPVWTGSCPCQPFSQAGKGKGTADERHLWPAFHHLIKECQPPVVFGEQVASPDGRAWLDTVQADLEGVGFAIGAADLCVAGIGSPHIRQRLWFVAERLADSSSERLARRTEQPAREECAAAERGGDAGGLGITERQQSGGDAGTGAETEGGSAVRAVCDGAEPPGAACGVADTTSREQGQFRLKTESRNDNGPKRIGKWAEIKETKRVSSSCPTNGFWRDADWLFCRDGKWRPVEPGTFPLAHGIPSRVGKLRGYGNAIVPQVAQAFIEEYTQCTK